MKHTISTTSIFFILTTLSLLVHRPLESMESDNSERSDSQRSAGSWSELRFSPDPTLASRLERIQECLVKHRLKPIITPDGFVFLESAADEQEVPQKETAPFPFIQTLTEKIRATPCVKNRYTLLSCVFYLHEFLTAVLSEIIERSSKTADPIRDLIEAFSLLDDAIKHYKKTRSDALKILEGKACKRKKIRPPLLVSSSRQRQRKSLKSTWQHSSSSAMKAAQ